MDKTFKRIDKRTAYRLNRLEKEKEKQKRKYQAKVEKSFFPDKGGSDGH